MIPFHPLADLFPMMSEAERAPMVADMKANGFRAGEEIVLLDGKILDGRNRYVAAIAAGLIDDSDIPFAGEGDWMFRLFDEQDGGGPLAWVIAKNIHRRHLDESQRAMVAAKIETLKQGRPKSEAEPADGKQANLRVSRTEAANLLNVSPRSVTSAAVVRDQAEPEIRRAVEQGQLAVSAAAKAVVMAPEKQRAIAEAAAAGKSNVVNAEIKKAKREVREAELGAKITALPTHDGAGQKFGVIVADPEWRFEVWSRESGLDRSADNHYPTSDQATIMARDVAGMAADDCVLGLWCTDLARGIDTLRAWGFTFKSYFVWVKDIVEVELSPDDAMRIESEYLHRSVGGVWAEIGPAGTGYWNADRDELLLIGTRGKPVAPAPGTQGESVWFAARPRDAESKIVHSAKPDCCLEWFERHYPSTPKIELNARRARPGWVQWGNEAPQAPEVESCGGTSPINPLPSPPPSLGEGITLEALPIDPHSAQVMAFDREVRAKVVEAFSGGTQAVPVARDVKGALAFLRGTLA